MPNLSIPERIQKLRQLMQKHGIDYYFVPSADAHHNEYVPACWQRREWISGFTGSAGDVLVGLNQAYLWTDPRYFLQAEMELDANLFQLMRQQQGMAAPIHEWLRKNAKNQKIGVDPKLISIIQAKRWQTALTEAHGQLISIEENLIDEARHNGALPTTHAVRLQDEKYTGLSAQQKISNVRKAMHAEGAHAHVLTALDAIAWLFNIRGSDIDFNPLVLSYALVTLDHATLFVDPKHITDELKKYGKAQGFELKPYSQIQTDLNHLTHPVLLDSSSASWWVEQQIKKADLVLDQSPITLMKSCKNDIELQGMREAHKYDAIAMCKFFNWLEHHYKNETEISVADKLEGFRRENPLCQGLSFTSICGFADHGAIIHYRSTPETNIKINDQHLFLIDTGGQYLNGTTDITRTIHLGKPSAAEKHYYTLVLKGHLALRHSVFPEGTNGEHLNAIAHLPLWKEGVDFGHGTGHGVGCYLCVHEGPQRISNALSGVALKPGMILSNEPGIYFPGKFGIRIENLCIVTKQFDIKQSATGHGPFYTFEDLTIVPYAQNLIDLSLLSAEEIKWINEYHTHIERELSPHLAREEQAWLKKATQPL